MDISEKNKIDITNKKILEENQIWNKKKAKKNLIWKHLKKVIKNFCILQKIL